MKFPYAHICARCGVKQPSLWAHFPMTVIDSAEVELRCDACEVLRRQIAVTTPGAETGAAVAAAIGQALFGSEVL